MKYTKHALILLSMSLWLLVALICTSSVGFWISLHFSEGGFARNVSLQERQIRMETVSISREWLGTEEGSTGHQQIIRIYNTHEPLARGYEVTALDNWCAVFGSCVAIQRNLTDLIPTECGCERQIDLWKNIGGWQELDTHMPLPGDYIYYNWGAAWNLDDNTGWSDHVGIVVGTAGPAIKVIEGNRDDCVTYRVLFRWDHRIRGYGLPNYASIK